MMQSGEGGRILGFSGDQASSSSHAREGARYAKYEDRAGIRRAMRIKWIMQSRDSMFNKYLKPSAPGGLHPSHDPSRPTIVPPARQ